MDKFIEKLIGRLEEGQKEAQSEGLFSFAMGFKSAKLIVKELAEEYNGGWISVEERLPEKDGKQYMVQMTNGLIDILRFTKDAYKLDKYDFAEYKGKKKQLFFEYDSEYGFIERECEAWQPLPPAFKLKGE